MTDLKPCPFCGGKPVLNSALGESWVSCEACGASVDMWGAEANTIEAWNRRAPEGGGVPVAWRYPSVGDGWAYTTEPLAHSSTGQPLYASPVLPDREGVVALLSSADENGQIMGPQWVAETTSAILSPTTEGGEDE